jgi:hypothetical protein
MRTVESTERLWAEYRLARKIAHDQHAEAVRYEVDRLNRRLAQIEQDYGSVLGLGRERS